MRIITDTVLKAFFRKHADSESAIRNFIDIAKIARWQNLADIKQDINSVDYVGNDRYCFNLKGNHYRLIVSINFKYGQMFVRFIGTHAEYSKIKDASNI